MAGATVLSVGSVTITANGGQTGDVLASIIAAAAGATVIAVGAGDTSIPAAPSTGGPFELVINPGYTGPLVIPPSVAGGSVGYEFVVYGGAGQLSGGNPDSAIIGNNVSYSGGAATVVGAGGAGSVNDTADNALLAFFGDYSVVASGNNDTVDAGSGSVNVTVTGTGTFVNVGGGSDSVAPGGSAAATSIAPRNVIDVSGGTSDVIFDQLGSNLVLLGQLSEYIAAEGTGGSFLTSATGGADTVFALSGTDYNATAASSTLFIGSNTNQVTVQAGSNAVLFGGSAGGIYTEGNDSAGSFFLWGNEWGAIQGSASMSNDTVIGTASSPSAAIWGNNNENVVIQETHGSAPAAFFSGDQFTAWGNNDTINAMDARGGNAFIAWNASLPANGAFPDGVNFTGNTTLIGSNAGFDDFAIFSAATAGTTLIGASAAHTIDIQNWQTSDALFLGGYSAQDLATADAAFAAAGGGAALFTLSDGTTIKFDTASPTTQQTDHPGTFVG